MNGVEDGQHTQNCPPEFKQRAVRLVWSSEEKHPEDGTFSGRFSSETLRRWVNQAKIHTGDREDLTTEDLQGYKDPCCACLLPHELKFVHAVTFQRQPEAQGA